MRLTDVILTEADSDKFRARFCEFYDSVVRSVVITPPSRHSSTYRCSIAIEAQDSTTGAWARITLELKDVSEFNLSRRRSGFEVLSSGLQLFWSKSDLLVVLDARPDDPGIPDLNQNAAW